MLNPSAFTGNAESIAEPTDTASSADIIFLFIIYLLLFSYFKGYYQIHYFVYIC